MRYITNLFFITGIAIIVVGAIALVSGNMMAAVRLMAGGVVAMGASSILSELVDWMGELRYE